MWNVDIQLMLLINAVAGQSEVSDRFITQVLMLPTVRMLPLVALLVWIWFTEHSKFHGRSAAIQGLLGGFIALVISRLIQNAWSYRPRPLHEPSLDFILPFGVTGDMLREWSSFPSDTTALAFALATAIFIASRRLGWTALAWSLIIVGAPRVYAGFHYPSDILGGAIIGIVAVLLCAPIARSVTVQWWVKSLEARAPALLYAGAFLALFQITILFDDVRVVARAFGAAVGIGS